jgi:hypothetical protein
MILTRKSFQLAFLIVANCVVVSGQTAGNNKQFSKDGLSFDYAAGWTLQDDSNGDAQNLSLARADSDVSVNVFVHRGKTTPEKLSEAKKAFIDPYILARGKQFIAMGAKPEQKPDSSEIAGVKADGVAITASLGGEPGAAKIYWTLIGNRVTVLTFFGPDKQLKQHIALWDLVRNSIKIEDPKAEPKASPKP